MCFRFHSVAAIVGAFVAQFVVATGPATARPLTPAEQRYARWQVRVPPCDSPAVVGVIKSRFGEREGLYWESGLTIATFDYIRESGFRSNGVDFIPRRYCSAKAIMSDTKVRQIYYAVGEDLGMTGTDGIGGAIESVTLGLLQSKLPGSFISTNWGVDWCIVGLDRNYAYGLNCKAARP
jgi:hypothetical protein